MGQVRRREAPPPAAPAPEVVTPEPKEKAEEAAPMPSDEAATATEDAKQEAAKAQSPAAGEAPSDDDKPEMLSAAREGGPDDLKKIKGIGPKLEKLCNQLGVWHFDQIASWTDREVAWVDHHLEGFNGRIVRDDWVAQAKALAEGKE